MGSQRCPVPAIRYSGVEFPTEGARSRVSSDLSGVDGWVLRSPGP